MSKKLSLYTNVFVFITVGFLVYYLIFLSLNKVYEKKIAIENLQENEKKIFIVMEQDKNHNIQDVIAPIEKHIVQYKQHDTIHIDEEISHRYKLFVITINHANDKYYVTKYLSNNDIYYINQNDAHEEVKKIYQEALFISLQLLVTLTIYISYLWYYAIFYLYAKKNLILYFWHHGLQNRKIISKIRGGLFLSIICTFFVVFCYEFFHNNLSLYQKKYLFVILWFILVTNIVRAILLKVTSNIIHVYEKNV